MGVRIYHRLWGGSQPSCISIFISFRHVLAPASSRDLVSNLAKKIPFLFLSPILNNVPRFFERKLKSSLPPLLVKGKLTVRWAFLKNLKGIDHTQPLRFFLLFYVKYYALLRLFEGLLR